MPFKLPGEDPKDPTLSSRLHRIVCWVFCLVATWHHLPLEALLSITGAGGLGTTFPRIPADKVFGWMLPVRGTWMGLGKSKINRSLNSSQDSEAGAEASADGRHEVLWVASRHPSVNNACRCCRHLRLLLAVFCYSCIYWFLEMTFWTDDWFPVSLPSLALLMGLEGTNSLC